VCSSDLRSCRGWRAGRRSCPGPPAPSRSPRTRGRAGHPPGSGGRGSGRCRACPGPRPGIRTTPAQEWRRPARYRRAAVPCPGYFPFPGIQNEPMRAEDFVAQRREDWNRLEDLLARAGAGHMNALTPAQVLTMAALYRRATADLARAQRDWPDEPVHRYLNGLVARGHGIVYRRGGEVWKRIRRFYAETLPRTYRAAWPYLLAAAGLMFVPMFIAFFIVLSNPNAAYAIVDPELIKGVHHHELWTHIPENQRVQAAGVIMTHNIQVVILAFGFGVVFGLPVVWVLVTNG